MFEVAGEKYYFDLEKLSDFVRFESKTPIEDMLETETVEDVEMGFLRGESSQMIDVTKWDMLKHLIEVLLSEQSTTDNKMGLKGLEGELSLSAKLAFNTLTKYKILNNE